MGNANKAGGKSRTPRNGPGPNRGSKPGKPVKGAAGSKAQSAAEARRVGLRGAAPWAARHAAKHAAEARARNAQPPPPGSARATLRVPEQAEQIKAAVSELHNLLVQIRAMRKNLGEKFFEFGKLLGTIQERHLYEAKGYTSFEAFLEREIDLSKSALLRLERVPRVFREEAAREIGVEGVLAALEAIDSSAAGARPAAPTASATTHALPLKPPVRRK